MAGENDTACESKNRGCQDITLSAFRLIMVSMTVTVSLLMGCDRSHEPSAEDGAAEGNQLEILRAKIEYRIERGEGSPCAPVAAPRMRAVLQEAESGGFESLRGRAFMICVARRPDDYYENTDELFVHYIASGFSPDIVEILDADQALISQSDVRGKAQESALVPGEVNYGITLVYLRSQSPRVDVAEPMPDTRPANDNDQNTIPIAVVPEETENLLVRLRSGDFVSDTTPVIRGD